MVEIDLAMQQELIDLLEPLTQTVAGFSYHLEPGLAREPFEADLDSDIARSVLRQAETVLGYAPPHRAEPFWTDASLLDRAGIPCLLFGASGAGAHAADEWVDIESVHNTTRILEAVIRDICG